MTRKDIKYLLHGYVRFQVGRYWFWTYSAARKEFDLWASIGSPVDLIGLNLFHLRTFGIASCRGLDFLVFPKQIIDDTWTMDAEK